MTIWFSVINTYVSCPPESCAKPLSYSLIVLSNLQYSTITFECIDGFSILKKLLFLLLFLKTQ